MMASSRIIVQSFRRIEMSLIVNFVALSVPV